MTDELQRLLAQISPEEIEELAKWQMEGLSPSEVKEVLQELGGTTNALES